MNGFLLNFDKNTYGWDEKWMINYIDGYKEFYDE